MSIEGTEGVDYPSPELIVECCDALASELEAAKAGQLGGIDIGYWMEDEVRMAALVMVLMCALSAVVHVCTEGHDHHPASCGQRHDNVMALLRTKVPHAVDLAQAMNEIEEP